MQFTINFLNERTNIEEDGTINNLTKVLESKSAKEFIVFSRDLISQMSGDEVPGIRWRCLCILEQNF